MSNRKNENGSYDRFSESLKKGDIGRFYIFHGDERYLLEHSINELRRFICPEGLGSFNYRRYEGKDLQLDDLDNAINTLPAFADRTLIEIHDYDIFKGKANAPAGGDGGDDKQRLAEIFSDLPEYVCLVLIYSVIPFKPDMRVKLNKEIQAFAQVVDFAVQEQSRLINWISRRFAASGKRISKSDAEYLAYITDGYMSALVSEIEKVSAYSDSETISRMDIDTVVTPVLNAFAYTLTDALLDNKYAKALDTLSDLFEMREPAQKVLFSISLKMRQFLAARICIESNIDKKSFMEMCSLRYDFQATALLTTARKTNLSNCRDAVLLCAKAAYDLNSSSDPDARLVELITQLSGIQEKTQNAK